MKVVLLTLATLLLVGCSTKEPVAYMPVRCDIHMPNKPTRTHDTFTDIQNILVYTESLEQALLFCIYGEV